MAKSNLETDISHFRAAAETFRGQVWISRESHVAVREEIVGRGWGEPGVTFLPELYGAAISEMLRAGTLPQRVKTAAELEAEARAAAELEARKKAGVMFSDNEEDNSPVRKLTDEIVKRDPFADHNARIDKALGQRSQAQARREETEARMDRGEAIPGLRDEHEQVFASSGLVNHYRTQEAQRIAREHNARVRAEWQRRKAAEAESQKGGGL